MDAKYLDEAIFEGPKRIEAGYCDHPVTLLNGSRCYPANRAGCAMLARWCLRNASKAANKYERWRWQMDAAKWYRLAAGNGA